LQNTNSNQKQLETEQNPKSLILKIKTNNLKLNPKKKVKLNLIKP